MALTQQEEWLKRKKELEGAPPPEEPPPIRVEIIPPWIEKLYDPKTKLFPPSPATVAAGSREWIIERETGEGFVDFFYANVSDDEDMHVVIELDSIEWLNLTPEQVRSASVGLGIDGWFGYLGSQIYSDPDESYGIVIVPTKNTAPFYKTLRVWVENTHATASYTFRRCLIGWRLKK